MARYLTDLADACRKSGLPVVECAGWRTRGHAAFTAVNTIMAHHTAGPRNGEAPSLGVVTNGRPGLAGPLSQIVLGRSGTVYVVAAGVAWHAGNTRTAAEGNYRAIGIEAEATGVDAWPAAQYDAYVRLCRALIDHYGLSPANVVGHKEAAVPRGRKIDPNFDMNAFRTAVGRAGGAAGPKPTPVDPTNKKVQPMLIERPLVHGKNYLRIICPVGSASGLFGRGWVSVSMRGGGNVTVRFQKNAAVDTAPPGAGKSSWENSRFRNASRLFQQLPDGTEYIELWADVFGKDDAYPNGSIGSVLIELEPK